MARSNREGDLFRALRGVPPMTDLSGRESLAKNVGPYGWRRESLAKHVGPYGGDGRGKAGAVQTGVLTAHPESAQNGPLEG